jgi:aspartyl/asparaginyl beta-hydroxylase (cupin superfamily)
VSDTPKIAGDRRTRRRVVERARPLVIRSGFRLLKLLERMIGRASLVGLEPFLPTDELAWVDRLEEQWPVIRAELDTVLVRHAELPNFQDISTDQASLTDDDRWKTFFFRAYGVRAEGNCARCPETARILDGIPGMTTAMFSILSPHKRIPEHRGPYRGVLRYHLGLLVPEPADGCGIEVGGAVGHWREGGSLLFDDTYPHRAWNDTDGVRVVLFVDVVRPLRAPVSWLNRLVITAISLSPYVQEGKRRQLDWEQRFSARSPSGR